MDFFEHQEKARKRTGWLVALFSISVLCIIAATYAVCVFIFAGMGYGGREASLFNPLLLAMIGGGVLLLVGGASFVKFIELRSGGRGIAESLGGRLIDHNSATASERRLLNVVEEMAIASGTAVPPVRGTIHTSLP